MNILRVNILALALTGMLTSSLPAQSWITNGLICYLPFNGNANDATGRGNNGIVQNAVLTSDRFGKLSAAYKFNGIQSPSASWIAVTNKLINIGQPQYTLHFWFKPGRYNQGANMLAGYNSTTAIGWNFSPEYAPSTWTNIATFWIGNGFGRWDIANASGPFTSYSTNSWYSTTAVKSNTLYRFYVNGMLQLTVTNASAVTYNLDDGLLLGTLVTNGGEAFAGNIDDLRVYNRALSPAEVASLYFYEANRTVQMVKAYTLDFEGLAVGTNYQLQVSTNLLSWTNWGAPFTATSDRYTNSIPFQRVDDWTKLFFRLVP